MMEDLIKLIPSSAVSIIGVAVLIVGGNIFITVSSEYGKSLFRKWFSPMKEKRQDGNPNYNGIERRSDSQHLEKSIAALMDTMKEFVNELRASHEKMADNIETVKRHQERNWKQLFEEELPDIRGKIKT